MASTENTAVAPVATSPSADAAEPLSAEALAARAGKSVLLEDEELRSPLDHDQGSTDGSSSGAGSSGAWNRDRDEPMLQDNEDRFCLFPIKENEVWRMYKQAEASFWTAEEIDLAVSRALPPRHPGTGPGTGSWAAVPRRAEARGSSPAANRSRRLPAACAPPASTQTVSPGASSGRWRSARCGATSRCFR